MRMAIEEIRAQGQRVKPTKGWTTELAGVLLEIENPRARLSRSETRGKLFSCLGELCWYLAKRDDLTFISYYIERYKRYAEDGKLFGAYGPRLFSFKGVNQVGNIIDLLRRKPPSRQAVIQLYDPEDIVTEHKDVPCTCTLQFMIREGKLNMMTNMRSNDVYLGLPHDVFSFTMLQEIIARTLSVELGTYKHAVGSLHLYDEHDALARRYLKEGWQSTTTPMPSMPTGSPWTSINIVLQAESEIRDGKQFDESRMVNVDPYWADIIRLLQVYRAWKGKDLEHIQALRGRMSSPVYHPFIDRLLP